MRINKPDEKSIEAILFKSDSCGTDYSKKIELEKTSGKRDYYIHAIIDDDKIKFRRPCKGHFTQKDVDVILEACGDFATMLLEENK